MTETLVWWPWHGRVCVATFDPPGAVARFKEWREHHSERFGPIGEWQVDVGRGLGGGNFVAVWVLRGHLPDDFPISDKTLDR